MQSSLEIYDLKTDQSYTMMVYDGHIEAPNWTPDGRHLIVNGSGHLFQVALEDPELIQIPIEGLDQLNNDHGVSPDGTEIVVSNSPHRGTSEIYVLPITGGTPRKVSNNAPSWWHGWSPDGTELAFTSCRNAQFGIATIPVIGGDERILITSPHHYDGPDYTPDGAWIWFNSDRGGSMDLWRIRPDGTELEQMTDDDAVNWFPHPAPDGKCVVYLAYEPGTTGHPANRDITLRHYDMATGKIRILIELFGGQGTINVPSWSPDSTQFAYVRYAPHSSQS